MENFVINLAREPQKFSKLCFPMNNRTITIAALKRTFPTFNFDCILNDVYRKIDAYASFPSARPTEERSQLLDDDQRITGSRKCLP